MTKPLTDEAMYFLRQIARWGGAATPAEIGRQISQADNSARQLCKRRGLVTYDGGYWRLTEVGLNAAVERRRTQ